MTIQASIVRTALFTLLAGALLLPAAPAHASTPDPTRSADFETIADQFGDGQGRIVNIGPAGETTVLAVDSGQGYGVYVSGDDLGASDTLAFCYEDPAMGLSTCEEDLPPGSLEYECDTNWNESWCFCTGLLDCIDLVETGPCSSELTCGEKTCTCDV